MSCDCGHHLERLRERLALLEGRVERTHRFGTIVEDKDIDVSDASKPRCRIQVGVDDDGQPVKGPWLPYATVAGARNMHSPPSKGQQFMMIAPDGEHEAGLLVPLGHSSKVRSPSTDKATDVDQRGKTKLTQTDGTWHQEVENAGISLSSGKVVITAGGTSITIEDGKVTFDTKLVKFGKNASLPVSIQGTVDTGGYVDAGPFSAVIVTE